MSEIDPSVLVDKQKKMFTYIQNFITNSFDKVAEPNRTVVHFETRLELLNKYWLSFFDKHDELIEYEKQLADEPYLKKDFFTQCELMYVNAVTKIKEQILLLKVNDNNVSINQHASNNSHLSTVLTQPFGHAQFKSNLPIFNGTQS